MTTIKGSCPLCGNVNLSPADVTLVICSIFDRSYYSFLCPKWCREEVRKPADRYIVRSLIGVGVRVERWIIPDEALQQHRGQALTCDDLLVFHQWLSGTDCLVEALA